MSCAPREHSIALYVEGDLRESERRSLESHLQGCSTCRDLADSLLSSLSAFKGLRQDLPQVSELSEVRQRVLNEVGDMQPAPGWVLVMHRLLFAGLRRKTAIAGMALVILTSGTLWFHYTPVSPGKVERSAEPSVQLAQIEIPSHEAVVDIHPMPNIAPRPGRSAHLTKLLLEAKPEISVPPPADVPVADVAQALQIPMKFFTDDPDIIIYWLPTDKGD